MRTYPFILVPSLALMLSGCNSNHDTEQPTTAAAIEEREIALEPIDMRVKADEVHAPGIRFLPPPQWGVEPTSSSMRVGQYVVRDPYNRSKSASLVVYYFGPRAAGSIEENIARWCDQFEPPDKRDSREAAQIEETVINTLPVTTVDVSGTYVAETSPGSGERVREEDYRLLASIIESAAGPYYVKFVGPRTMIEANETSYRSFLMTFHARSLESEEASSATEHP